mmetsp:Transcript_16287/g.42262  ORF Transcript_16287/g.42262 Transcript_16287/m.42262 type:complete len:320 (-) Transcript_16287:287-1246(-)
MAVRLLVALAAACAIMAPAHAVVGGSCTPTGGVYTISTDDDLDDIPADCQVVLGSIHVGCATAGCQCNVTHLGAFHLVERVTGYLRVEGCDALATLQGLNALKVVEGQAALFGKAGFGNGFAVWIEDNDGLGSLSGLKNLSAVGRGVTPPGRVYISGNDNLCGTELVDWDNIVDRTRVVVDVAGTAGTSGNCAFTGCSADCGCHDRCFGPDASDCQGFCDKRTDAEVILVDSVLLATIVVAVVTLFLVLCRTQRMGCRLNVFGKEMSAGLAAPPRHTALSEKTVRESATDLAPGQQTEHAQPADTPPVSDDRDLTETQL